MVITVFTIRQQVAKPANNCAARAPVLPKNEQKHRVLYLDPDIDSCSSGYDGTKTTARRLLGGPRWPFDP